MITRIKTAAVYVEDQQRALEFYRDKVGFELVADQPMGPDARWLEVAPRGAATHIVLYPRAKMKDWESKKPSIAFDCPNTEATYEQLSARGVKFTQTPTTMEWGTFAKFVDPDGNEFLLTDV